MDKIDLTRIFEHPWESLFKLVCKLPQVPRPGTRIVLDKRTIELMINKMDELSQALVASPDDANGNMAYDRSHVVYLERLLFLCRLMTFDDVTFEGCKCVWGGGVKWVTWGNMVHPLYLSLVLV